MDELSARQGLEYSQAKSQLEPSGQDRTRLRLAYDAAAKEVAAIGNKLRLQLQTAWLVADAAARIRFENIDKDNFLLIVAPVDGVITDVTSTESGDKIQANTPLGGIAPKIARPVLKIEIAEQDRAFLKEGLAAKLKFNVFPFQRYGMTAVAEIAVRERRLIDLALDPFRQIGG